jgi:poly-D-alanine transfer protein DltD
VRGVQAERAGLATAAARAPAPGAEEGPVPAPAPASCRRPRPLNVVAAALATAIAVAAAQLWAWRAQRVAAAELRAVAPLQAPIKWKHLLLQRAAYADGHFLPLYGSSELYCCGLPYLPTQVFASEPTGFDVFALGQWGTADLYFAETLCALGPLLRGRPLVLSDSTWFNYADGFPAAPYEANFSPEVATACLLDGAVPPDLRAAIARRMAAYPDTLRPYPLLRTLVADLAAGTPAGRAAFAALVPVAQLAGWVQGIQGAEETVAWLDKGHPTAKPAPPPYQGPLVWSRMLAAGTRLERERSGNNPFGLEDSAWVGMVQQQDWLVRPALARYCGQTPMGYASADTAAWLTPTLGSPEWGDLALALRVSRALGARTLVWLLPFKGAFLDYTPVAAAAREVYYQRFAAVAEAAGVPALTFTPFDEDRYFLASGSHFSARGWVLADAALDEFWHGRTPEEIATYLVTLALAVPAPYGAGAPVPWGVCAGYGVHPEAARQFAAAAGLPTRSAEGAAETTTSETRSATRSAAQGGVEAGTPGAGIPPVLAPLLPWFALRLPT